MQPKLSKRSTTITEILKLIGSMTKVISYLIFKIYSNSTYLSITLRDVKIDLEITMAYGILILS